MAEEGQCIIVTGHVVNFHASFPYSIDFQTKSQAPPRRKKNDDDDDDVDDDDFEDNEPENDEPLLEDNLEIATPTERKELQSRDDIKENEPMSSESSNSSNGDNFIVKDPPLSNKVRRELEEAKKMHSSKLAAKRGGGGVDEPRPNVPKKEKPPPKKKIKVEKTKVGYGRFKIVGDIVKQLTCICIEFTFVLRPAGASTWTIFEIRAAKVPSPLTIENIKKKLANLIIKDKGNAMSALEKYKTDLKLTIKMPIDNRIEQYTNGTPLHECLRNVLCPADDFLKMTHFAAEPAALGDAPLDASALDVVDLESCLFAYPPRGDYWNHVRLAKEKKTVVDAAFVYHDAIRRGASPFNSPAIFEANDKKWTPEMVDVFQRNPDKVAVIKNASDKMMLRLAAEVAAENRLAVALAALADLKIVRCEDYSKSGGVYGYIQKSIATLKKRAIIYSVLPRMEDRYKEYLNAISCSRLTYKQAFRLYASSACMLVVDRAHLLKCDDLAELIELAKPFDAVMLCGSKLFYPRWSVYPFRGIMETVLPTAVHQIDVDFPYNLTSSFVSKIDKSTVGGAAIIVANAEIKARYLKDFPDKKHDFFNIAAVDVVQIPPCNAYIVLEGMRDDTLTRAVQWTCNIGGILRFVGTQTNVMKIVADARDSHKNASPFEKILSGHMFSGANLLE